MTATETPEASIRETAFRCPHCGAYTTQTWADAYGVRLKKEQTTPFIPDQERLEARVKEIHDADERAQFTAKVIPWAKRILDRELFAHQDTRANYTDYKVENLFVSECFNCRKLALWVHDRLVHPAAKSGEPPNLDMPPHIRVDYEEARTVLDKSPRGAAALLRLAIQKLCLHLGESGKDINGDIASLVTKGLDQMTADALDAVRVIGNEAVHPGQMDLRDDRDTAAELFFAVNFIVDQMITKKRKLAEMYAKLPAEKRAAIDQRNAKARGK